MCVPAIQLFRNSSCEPLTTTAKTLEPCSNKSSGIILPKFNSKHGFGKGQEWREMESEREVIEMAIPSQLFCYDSNTIVVSDDDDAGVRKIPTRINLSTYLVQFQPVLSLLSRDQYPFQSLMMMMMMGMLLRRSV